MEQPLRYLVAKLSSAISSTIRTSRGKSVDATKETPPKPVARSSFSEKVQWMNPLRGTVGPTAKEAADALAIGGLRNTADSVSRLSYSVKFGRGLGESCYSPTWTHTKTNRRSRGLRELVFPLGLKTVRCLCHYLRLKQSTRSETSSWGTLERTPILPATQRQRYTLRCWNRGAQRLVIRTTGCPHG